MKNYQYSIILCSLFLASCASYVTPGRGVSLSEISDTDIQILMSREAAADFPARIAVARVQGSGYRSLSADSYGYGRYSLVTTRDIAQEKDFVRLAQLDGVAGIAPINQFFLPQKLDSIRSLRIAAARLKTDILLIYTFNTRFYVGKQELAPLNLIALGLLNNKKVEVTTTVSSAFFDVRTEYLYGISEVSHTESAFASVWSDDQVVDDLRIKTEKQSFAKLIPILEKNWQEIIAEYQPKAKIESEVIAD